jgi:hypothetical protein
MQPLPILVESTSFTLTVLKLLALQGITYYQ